MYAHISSARTIKIITRITHIIRAKVYAEAFALFQALAAILLCLID